MRESSLLQLYRARCVLPISAPLLEDGAVLVSGGIILRVAPYQELQRDYPHAKTYDLGEVILMPGLINAHCHLDYTMMRGKLQPGSAFASWIQALNKIKFSLTEKEILAGIEEGARELLEWGCKSVCNITSFTDLISDFSVGSLRLWQCLEVMDIRGQEQGKMGLAAAETFFKKKQQSRILAGIAPHAPYTASKNLCRQAARLAKKYQRLFCIHLAESEEEKEMFTQGSGALFEFLKNFGREKQDYGAPTPLQSLLQEDLIPQGALLVHLNCLDAKDRTLLAERASDFFVVHCPKTHRFFQRAPFEWSFFYKNGYRLLLGTDSLASNDALNLFEEMQLMAATAPELEPQEILKMVTLHPAAALGMKERLGELCVGAFAEMIAIPFSGKVETALEVVLHAKRKPMQIEGVLKKLPSRMTVSL